MIPLFVMEEHHEAFFLWNYAISKNIIDPINNELIHIDSHSDMSSPRFFNSINNLKNNLKDIIHFTYNDLDIANFIITALYKKIFNSFYWMPPRLKNRSTEKTVEFVRSYQNNGKVLVGGQYRDTKKIHKDEIHYNYQIISIKDNIKFNENSVLDIDLDYFSCEMYLYPLKILEVTENEFNNFKKNRYHFLKTTGSRIKPVEQNGKYYFYFDFHEEQIKTVHKLTKVKIEERMEKFIDFLKRNKIKPKMIDICRSRLTGYTPNDQWKFIEELLIKNISKLYDIEIKNIDDILKEEKLEEYITI